MTTRADGDEMTASARPDRTAEWDGLRATYLRDRTVRPSSTARGVHHVALLSSDVEQTIRFRGWAATFVDANPTVMPTSTRIGLRHGTHPACDFC